MARGEIMPQGIAGIKEAREGAGGVVGKKRPPPPRKKPLHPPPAASSQGREPLPTPPMPERVLLPETANSPASDDRRRSPDHELADTCGDIRTPGVAGDGSISSAGINGDDDPGRLSIG